jgi:enoyl-CoA hydratase/carnithine racemase
MQWLESKTEAGVAVLTMNYENENRLSGPFTRELREALAGLERDEQVKAAVITGGQEKFFSNGLDLNWMGQQDEQTLNDFLLNLTRLLKDTAIFGKPLIGAINGHTFGLGTIWASGFDFRIMREDRGWVCFPEMDINIPFLPGMIAICEHGLGKRTFREMAWSAKRYSGPEAVTVGWAREAVAKDEVLPSSIKLANFMAQKAQPAFALTKKRWAREVVRIIDELDPEAIKER